GHTISKRDWSSDVCSSDVVGCPLLGRGGLDVVVGVQQYPGRTGRALVVGNDRIGAIGGGHQLGVQALGDQGPAHPLGGRSALGGGRKSDVEGERGGNEGGV